MPSRGPMDPDRYWKRDIGRRVTRAEKQNDYRKASMVRLVRRVKDLENIVNILEGDRLRLLKAARIQIEGDPFRSDD